MIKAKLSILLTVMIAIYGCKTNHLNSKQEPLSSGDMLPVITDQDSLLSIFDEKTSIKILADTLHGEMADTILVELQNEFSVGKLWMIKQQDEAVQLIIQKDVQKVVNDKKTDFQQFLFWVEKPGVYKIEFENKRPFGEQTASTTLFKQTLIIHPKK